MSKTFIHNNTEYEVQRTGGGGQRTVITLYRNKKFVQSRSSKCSDYASRFYDNPIEHFTKLQSKKVLELESALKYRKEEVEKAKTALATCEADVKLIEDRINEELEKEK